MPSQGVPHALHDVAEPIGRRQVVRLGGGACRLERRTDLLFDTRAGVFLLGFQEVFHEK